MQLTNSATIVDFFPEAFIAEACEKKGMKVVITFQQTCYLP